MRFAVETWAPEYGSGPDEGHMETASGTVDATVERELAAWAPVGLDGAAAVAPDHVCFVDGVRRIDARVWIQHEGRTRPGACATVAAGVVRCDADGASVVESRVERILVAAAEGAGPIATPHATYELQPVADDSSEGIFFGVHQRMTALEASMSSTDRAGLVVFDGPLRGRNLVAGVGFVKTHHVRYLPDEVEPVIGALGIGERTPLFLIGQGPVSRWSWYLRLPGTVAHAYSGVVRCELPAVGTAEQAADRADQVTGLLPRYASHAHKDPRAPQNLYPIAGLERELRRRLGDPLLLERSLRVAAAQEG